MGRGVPGFSAKMLALSCSHPPSYSLPTLLPRALPTKVTLCLLLLTSLFSLDNDIVCGLEQVTAALACEGRVGKVREDSQGAKT